MADVSDSADGTRLIVEAHAALGRIDALVNNDGTAAVYLVSPAASQVTGTMFDANNGAVEYRSKFPDL